MVDVLWCRIFCLKGHFGYGLLSNVPYAGELAWFSEKKTTEDPLEVCIYGTDLGALVGSLEPRIFFAPVIWLMG